MGSRSNRLASDNKWTKHLYKYSSNPKYYNLLILKLQKQKSGSFSNLCKHNYLWNNQLRDVYLRGICKYSLTFIFALSHSFRNLKPKHKHFCFRFPTIDQECTPTLVVHWINKYHKMDRSRMKNFIQWNVIENFRRSSAINRWVEYHRCRWNAN